MTCDRTRFCWGRRIAVLVLCCVTVVGVAPFIGLTPVPFSALFEAPGSSTASTVLWNMRVPRVIAAFVTGAGLGVGGLAFQIVFRNALATPFTLGVSSGAAFLAALYFLAGIPFALGAVPGSVVASFFGALFALLLLRAFTSIRGGSATDSILLAGVMLSYIFSSLVVLIQYLSDFNALFKIARWMMGGFEGLLLSDIWLLLIIAFVSTLLLVMRAPRLNLLAIGEDFAASHGIHLENEVRSTLFLSCLMIAAVVAIAGPVGFVGIVVPHLARMAWGGDVRLLMLGSFAGGGVFLVLCDALARVMLAPYELPVGVVTALIGGPFFLHILWRQLRRCL